jgi:hypothetical protein
MADDNALTSRASVLERIANPQVVNPVNALSTAASAAQSIYGVREKQAQQAWGEVLQQATDANGNVDYPLAQRLASERPEAAMGMQTALKDTSQLRTSQIANSANHMKLLGTAAMTIARNSSDANVDAVFDNLAANGVPDGEVARERARWKAMSPDERADNAYRVGLSNLEQLHQVLGTTTPTNVGPVVVPVTTVPAAPGRPATTTVGGGGVTLGLTPGEQAGKVEWTTPDGIVHQGTSDQYRAATGQEPPTGGKQVPIPGAIPANPNVPPGTQPGRVEPTNPALRNPNTVTPAPAPAPAPAATPASVPAPTAPASPFGAGAFGSGAAAASAVVPPATTPASPPAQPAVLGTPVAQPAPGMGAKWDASAKQYTTAASDAGSYQARMQPIVSARAIIERNPNLTTGKGAEALNSIKSGLQTLITGLTPYDVQTINQAKFDELGKYFQQAVNANPFAGASDARLASAIGGSPNLHMSTLANTEVLKGLIGLERMKQMAFTEFQGSGKPPSQFSDFLSDWQSSHDPRAFVMDMLDGSHREKVLASLTSPASRAAFQNSLNLVKANAGLMTQAPMTQ